jgi:tetratricopeptide (TPR) repeat protein
VLEITTKFQNKLHLIAGIFCIFLSTTVVAQDLNNIMAKNNAGGEKEKNAQAESYFIDGQKFFLLEDYASALRSFKLAVELYPENAAINYKIAQIQNLQGNTSEALIYIDIALKNDSNNRYYYELAAEIYREIGDFNEAAKVYENLLETTPEAIDVYVDLAEIYIYLNNNDKALFALEKAEETLGITPEIISEKQKILLQQDRLEDAINEGLKLTEAYPEEPSFIISLSNILISLDRPQEAADYLKEYLANQGESAEVRLMLAETDRLQGLEMNAKENLLIAFKDPQLDIRNKIQIVGTYIEMLPNLELEPFVSDLAVTLVNVHDESAAAHGMYADFLFAINRPHEALESYIKSVKLDESNFQVWQNILSLQLQFDKIDELEEYAEKALEYFPNVASIYFFNGSAKIRKNDYAEAISMFETGSMYASKNEELGLLFLGQLGDAYNGAKNYKKSDEAYEKALAIDPNNGYVLNNYSYYLSMRGDKLERAQELSARLIKNYPNNPNYLDTHAWVLYKLEKYEKALPILIDALKTIEGASNGTIVEHYGDVLFKLGKSDLAMEQWIKAKSLGNASEWIEKKIAEGKLYE